MASALTALVDRVLNRVTGGQGASSDKARELFGRLDVCDLHADSLLWERPLLQRGRRGHADIPRLIEGRFALQVFGLVTKMPRHLSGSNDASTDWIWWLSRLGGWPERTRESLIERALYQAGRLREAADASAGRFAVVRSRAELAECRSRGALAGLLAVEGAHALEGDLANLDRLYEAGVRMVSPSHFFDTEIGGSAHGMGKGGLSELGRRWLSLMEERRMIVDLAHVSARTFSEVLALAKRPVVVSHTGVRGTCDNQRNLSDDQLRAVAADGGLVGIGYWKMAVCGTGPDAIARAVRHAAKVAGVAHVALGSDFDGAVAAPFDATRLDLLVDALLREGFGEAEIRRIMGENALEFFAKNLP